MRSSAAALLLTSSTLTQLTHAHSLPQLAIQRRDRHTQGRTRDVAHGLVRRQGTLETTVFDILTYSAGGAYYANISVGTPAQDQTVIVDTGSSDLYLDASNSKACESNGKHACKGGDFTPGKSSTYSIAEPSPAFNTSFGDGSTAVGPYGRDMLTIGDITLSNVQFGVAETVRSTTGFSLGLIGVGYSANEATLNPYPNVPEVLVDAGVINSRLYSVYLNDGEADSGNILFGGIDTDKYTGPLQTVDILPDLVTRQVDRFITSVTALSVTVSGKKSTVFSGGKPGINAYRNNDNSQAVLLDTGSAAWSVEPQLYEHILQRFPYVDRGICECSHRYSSDSLAVTFNDAITINVPAEDFILPLFNPKTNQPETFQGEEICAFMIVEAEPNELGFQPAGDAILRSMYIVYDLDNGQMALAQANVNSTSSNVKTVPAGPSGIAKVAPNVKTVGANNFSVAATATASVTFSAVSGKTTVGEITGAGAVPHSAQTSTAGGPSSSGAASPSLRPSFDWSGVYVSVLALAMAALGFGIML